MRVLPPRFPLFIAAALIVAISGASLVWNGPAAPSWSAGGVVAEYRSEAARLQLAPGWSWPKKLSIAAGTRDAPMHYGKGSGTEMAQHRWFCSWATRAFSKELSPKLRRDALKRLAPKTRDRASFLFSRWLPEVIVTPLLRGEIRDKEQLQTFTFDICRTP
jgi:hypothetical protein